MIIQKVFSEVGVTLFCITNMGTVGIEETSAHQLHLLHHLSQRSPRGQMKDSMTTMIGVQLCSTVFNGRRTNLTAFILSYCHMSVSFQSAKTRVSTKSDAMASLEVKPFDNLLLVFCHEVVCWH